MTTAEAPTYRNVTLDEGLRREVCDWLRANNIDPARLPLDSQMKLHTGLLSSRPLPEHGADASLTTLVKDTEDGHDVLNAERTDVVKHFETFPIHVLPTGAVKEWLDNACPTCGRHG